MDDLEISPAEARQRLERGENVMLVDVREPWEFELCRIAGAKLIPMGTIPANLQGHAQHGCGGVAAWARRCAREIAFRRNRSLVHGD